MISYVWFPLIDVSVLIIFAFVASYIPSNPGPIIDLTTNKEIGKHTGLWTYTIGEKARIGGMPMKMFVAKKDTRKNIIYVVPGSCVAL